MVGSDDAELVQKGGGLDLMRSGTGIISKKLNFVRVETPLGLVVGSMTKLTRTLEVVGSLLVYRLNRCALT